MTDLMRLVVLLLILGAAVTALASGVLWYGDERRRIGRALVRVLKGQPDAVLIARGRGRGVGLNVAGQSVAVAWDKGAWCLVYRLEELIGAELLIDGEVRARAFRGETRRALERVSGSMESVSLRLIFDDPRHPDFELDLWEQGEESGSPAASVQEANRWIASVESLLRRAARRAEQANPQAPAAPLPPPASPPQPDPAPPPPPPPAPPPQAAQKPRPMPIEDREPDLFDDLTDPDDDN